MMATLQGSRSAAQCETYGQISIFLDQLVEILVVEEQTGAVPFIENASAASPLPVPTTELAHSATSHGKELRKLGFTIEEVVRTYGGLCQAITTLAIDLNAGIEVVEFRTLNRCLDEGIAQAVVAYGTPDPAPKLLAPGVPLKRADRLDDLAAMFSHVETAISAALAARAGVGLGGATGVVLDRSLESLSSLIQEQIRQTD